MQVESKSYFKNLDGLRFILAVVVFGSHAMLGQTINQLIPNDTVRRLIVVFTTGSLAVSFFFVLSGFLITYLMIEEKETSGSFNIKHFYVRRIFRIWPLYFTVLLFGFLIYPYIKGRLGYVDANPFSPLYQFLFISNFDSIRVAKEGLVDVAPMMIGITWSVSIEEQFYLVWPLLFSLVKPKLFWITCLVVIIISAWFRLTTQNWNLYYHTLAVVSDMGIGALGAAACFYSEKFVKLVARLPKLLIVTAYIIGFLMLMFPEPLFQGHFLERTTRLFNSIFFCFVIIEQNYAHHSVFKFGNFKRMSAWGKYTYALYMLHPIGIQFSIILYRYLNIQQNESVFSGLAYAFIAFSVSLVLSVLSYRYVEQYFLRKRALFY